MQVFLLRHGETDWNFERRCQGTTDLDLNGTGVRQAEAAASYLSKETIHAVYSSDLKRAILTADFISRPHDLKVTVDGDFRELHHGELEGLTFSEIRTSYPDFIRIWKNKPAELPLPGGERLVDVERRVWKGLKRIQQSHLSHETVVVVSHNFPILAVLCGITGTPLDRYRSFHIDPCGLNHLSYDSTNGWRINRINKTSYLSHCVTSKS
jgi:broad specificity phosphatase PhoE